MPSPSLPGWLSLRNCHGGFRAAWLQRFVFAPENRHLDDVPIATVLKVVLAPPAFLDETAFPIASDSARVELEYAELDLIQIHLIEGEAKQSHHSVGPVAVRPVRLIAHHDAQGRVAVSADPWRRPHMPICSPSFVSIDRRTSG